MEEKIQFKDIVDQIANFRKEALNPINITTHTSYDLFYQILSKHCYSNYQGDGIFYNIIKLLYGLLNELKLEEKAHFTFWLNYIPRCINANEKLGRLINPNEFAYCTKEGGGIQILTSDNKTDAIVYYFQQIMGNNIGNKNIMSIQEALNNTNNEIDIMSMSYCKRCDEIVWRIRDNNAIEKREKTSALTTSIFTGEYQSAKQESYDYFLRKTFKVAVDSSIEFVDEFNWDNACYTPSCFYVCNLSLPYTSSQNNRGSIMFSSSIEIPLNEISNILNKLKGLIELLVDVEIDFKGLLDKKAIQLESLKSAKAAIMSRNMSHNLGSHVMFYIKQKLQSVSKIVNSSVLENIISPGDLSNIDAIVSRIEKNTNVELPFLVGLGRFINYLQERQDYIATVATDYIPARSTISFKDFIYDELKPELRYKRHHSNNPNGDAGWQSGNLLLDYIAYSEDYCSSDDIVIKFGDFDGEHSRDDKGEELVDFQNLRKFNIAIPGGVIGRQAIFSIFENIIRNAAKHSERRDDNKLVLQLSLLKNEEELNKLGNRAFRARREGDNEKSALELIELYKNYWDTYYYLRIKIEMPNQPKSISKLVESLADPYIENGVMKDTAKGLKEMRISAAWLRGHDIDTNIPLSEPPVLSVYSEPYSGDSLKETLSYILCIPKPKKVAFLVKDNSNYDRLNRCIEPFGCKIFGYQDVFDKYDKINDTIPNYEIVCMLDDTDINKKVYPQISSRYIASSNITLDIVDRLNTICENTKDKNQINALLKSEIDTIYDIWYQNWCQSAYPGRKDYKLTILDDKTVDNSKTKSLRENYAIADNETVILDSTGNINQAYCTNAVVYKTHFKGLQTEPKNSYLTSAVCIESITGNNSTARFIRQDKWNKMWKSKLLSSGMAKVAIFDERIFSTFVTSKGSRPYTEIYDLLKSKSEDEIVDELTKTGFTEDEAYAVAYEDPGFNKIIESKCKQYNVEVAQKNHERGIWAFDIEPQNDAIVIKGYNVCIDDKVNAFEMRYPAEIQVATIKKYDDEYCLVDVNDTIFPKGTKIFDLISMHLGILDKIYNAFKIKGNEIEMRKVTNAIHRIFAKADTPLDCNEFLPNFIIHSGRAKPSKLDMPQEQPFVQFAAIDYAVKDCKYTLVELLISAYHENSNSNN